MRIFVAFIIGISIGIFALNYYISGRNDEKVLSASLVKPDDSPTATEIPRITLTVYRTPTEAEETETPLTPTDYIKINKPTASLSPTNKPTLTPPPSASVSPVPRVTLSPTPTPEVQISYKTYTSEEINGFIDRFASQYSVDPNFLRHIALCESGFNPLAQNGIYAGLYQFSPSSWQNYRSQIGEDQNAILRFDGEEAVQTAAYVLSAGKSSIWPNCT